MQSGLRVLTKSRKNEALIRNDGVYVISGIFCRANACVCGKNAFPSRPLAANRQICKRSGRFVGKPKVCQRFECGRGQASPTSAFSTEAEMHELLKQSAAAYLAALHLRIAGDDRIERLRVQISQSRVQRLCEPGRIPAHEQADPVLSPRSHACQHIRTYGATARQRAKLP